MFSHASILIWFFVVVFLAARFRIWAWAWAYRHDDARDEASAVPFPSLVILYVKEKP